MTEIGIDHIIGIEKDKSLGSIIGDSCKTDTYNVEMIVGEEIIDIKIIIEMTVEIEGDKPLGEASVMIDADQEKEA